MLGLIAAFLIPSLVSLLITRIFTNIIYAFVIGLCKWIVFSVLKMFYIIILLIVWILFLPLTLINKMTVRRSSPLRWLVLLSLMALSAFVAYDVSLHGSFNKSQTGQILKELGILKQTDMLVAKTKYQYAVTQKWFKKNGPTFLKQAGEYIKPYLILMKNLLIIFSNAVVNGVVTAVKYVAIKLPLLHEAIESYCPGITESTKNLCFNAWQAFLYYGEYALFQSIVALKLLGEYLRQTFTQLIDYLQKNVFVGDYAPDKLQKMAFQGVSVVQEYVSNSVTWISHKLTDLAQ